MRIYATEMGFQGELENGESVSVDLETADFAVPIIKIHHVSTKNVWKFTIPELLEKLGIEINPPEDAT